MLTCDVPSHARASSVLGHLVEGGERREDAALVGLDDVPVLDHLVQDDVDSVQVEHDLTAPGQRNTHTRTHTQYGCDVTAQLEGYVQFTLLA